MHSLVPVPNEPMAARVATQSAIERFGGGAVFGVKPVSPRRRSRK